MNIFVLSEDPIEAALAQCDKHVVKMITETAQLLSLGYSKFTSQEQFQHAVKMGWAYRPTHENHPCSKWTLASKHNRRWLLEHADGLARTYTQRYGRVHKSQHVIDCLFDLYLHCEDGDPAQHTPFTLCMPEQYRGVDPVQSYRAFYIGEKARFAKWNHGPTPRWWPR